MFLQDHISDFPILSAIIFLPLIGSFFILFLKNDPATQNQDSKIFALWISSITFLLSLLLIIFFDRSESSFQFVETRAWIQDLSINYKVGVDGISVWFVLLTTFLVPICILASWETIQDRVKEYMIVFLILETLLVGMFSALDLVTFYVLFEGVLIPMFIIIGVWGGSERVYASFKFFLFTLTGSVLLLVAILVIYSQTGTTDIVEITQTPISENLQYWIWLAFFASFAVKIPMWPLHTWLPDAHVEAPTAGSVMLAGVLLKMGAYGFLRLSIPILPHASIFFTPLVFTLSIIAIVYVSILAFAQEDMKKLIAYSSIAHMGFVTLGIFTGNIQGVEGAIFQMLSHGIISAALFLCVGTIYDRAHSRDIAYYGGLVKKMPNYALIFMIFILGAIGLPGTSGFIGEFLTLLGAFQVNKILALFAGTGVVLSAGYMLWLYRRVILGSLVKKHLKKILDVNKRELTYFIPLVFLVIWMGIYPDFFLDLIHVSAESLVSNYSGEKLTYSIVTH